MYTKKIYFAFSIVFNHKNQIILVMLQHTPMTLSEVLSAQKK
jgi:hypothetical protein